MTAILFGSISTLADTSELQRASFNKAFVVHELGWSWSRQGYQEMLDTSGGADRIAFYARSRGEQVDAAAVHRTKSEIFQRDVATVALQARANVANTILGAAARGVATGLVTTTSAQNVAVLLEALAPSITADMFDVIVDASMVDEPKPAGAAYQYALKVLHEEPEKCVAIEDNVDGVEAAHAAGVTCVAFPNRNTTEHNFTHADHHIDTVHLDELIGLLPTR